MLPTFLDLARCRVPAPVEKSYVACHMSTDVRCPIRIWFRYALSVEVILPSMLTSAIGSPARCPSSIWFRYALSVVVIVPLRLQSPYGYPVF